MSQQAENRAVALMVLLNTSKSDAELCDDVRDTLQDLADRTSDGDGSAPVVRLSERAPFVELNDVKDFHLKFKVPEPSEPSLLNAEAFDFRTRFLQEELDEFVEDHINGDMLKAADALVDLVYVALGTAIMMGLAPSWPALWAAVQAANMKKERATSASQSKRGSALDVVKPIGWTSPDHSLVLGNGPWSTFEPAAAQLDADNRELARVPCTAKQAEAAGWKAVQVVRLEDEGDGSAAPD